MTIGIVAAHADDESLGAGGTIAQWSREQEVHLLVMADGVTGRKGTKRKDVSARIEMCDQAKKILGISSVVHLNYRDNRLDIVAVAELAARIEIWLSVMKPDMVLTHHAGDLNQDHRRVFEAVLIATRSYPGQCVRRLWCFELPSSTEWAFGQLKPFAPNAFVDISETIRLKQSALECYASEMREFPHPRSPLAVSSRAVYWGQIAGVGYAEPFEVVREIW